MDKLCLTCKALLDCTILDPWGLKHGGQERYWCSVVRKLVGKETSRREKYQEEIRLKEEDVKAITYPIISKSKLIEYELLSEKKPPKEKILEKVMCGEAQYWRVKRKLRERKKIK